MVVKYDLSALQKNKQTNKKNNCTYIADANTKDIFNNQYFRGLSEA